jgi:hypothetical protein
MNELGELRQALADVIANAEQQYRSLSSQPGRYVEAEVAENITSVLSPIKFYLEESGYKFRQESYGLNTVLVIVPSGDL